MEGAFSAEGALLVSLHGARNSLAEFPRFTATLRSRTRVVSKATLDETKTRFLRRCIPFLENMASEAVAVLEEAFGTSRIEKAEQRRKYLEKRLDERRGEAMKQVKRHKIIKEIESIEREGAFKHETVRFSKEESDVIIREMNEDPELARDDESCQSSAVSRIESVLAQKVLLEYESVGENEAQVYRAIIEALKR